MELYYPYFTIVLVLNNLFFLIALSIVKFILNFSHFIELFIPSAILNLFFHLYWFFNLMLKVDIIIDVLNSLFDLIHYLKFSGNIHYYHNW
jgi:hypothetical protein